MTEVTKYYVKLYDAASDEEYFLLAQCRLDGGHVDGTRLYSEAEARGGVLDVLVPDRASMALLKR